MNRNVESHFSMLPSAEISRSRFDRSQDIKFTFDVGELIPFFWDFCYPGDTFDITTSKVIRLQTLLTPVMDNIYLDTYFFSVPVRLLHTHWREIMGENRSSAWLPDVEYTVPQIIFQKAAGDPDDDDTNAGVAVGDVLDYLGIPVGVSSASDNEDPLSVMAYPLRAYWSCVNEWFRDENLVDPVNWSDGDADMTYQQVVSAGLDKPFVAAKFHDYFTSALPNAQANDTPVKVPAGFSSSVDGVEVGWPVNTPSYASSPTYHTATDSHPLLWRDAVTGSLKNTRAYDFVVGDNGYTPRYYSGTGTATGMVPANLFARPAANADTGLFMYVSDLRYAFQLQKLYERDARGGRRYIELIRSHFGVSSPDSRLQRPEYLGGNRIPISIHQITNQSQGENDFLGDLGAMSLTTDKHSDFVYSATEHCIILGLCVARYDHSYSQSIERIWSPKTRFDFYWPVFANLSEQAILKKEICATGNSSDNEVFGFQERWAELRYKPNRTAAEMRPGVANTLSSWHFSDYYDSVPTLSSEWIQEDKTNVDRALAVTSSLADQIFCDIYVQNYTTRPMPLYSIPGLIDHH